MANQQMRFDDGAAYERMMGTWSRYVGDAFIDWLSPAPGVRWIDVGCGNGAFSELLANRCDPAEVHGIDPVEGQLAYARSRPCGEVAEFHQGKAEALPFPENRFDAAVMALVIFFVPNPAASLTEMVRVVCPGGSVSSYTWDVFGGGFPLEPIQAELRAMDITPPLPPSADASRMEVLRDLWSDASLDSIETTEITVLRTFGDFDDFWTTTLISSLASVIDGMNTDDIERLKTRVKGRLPADSNGSITYEGRANAIKGVVPG